MTRLGKRDRMNAMRTAELHNHDPKAVLAAQECVAEMAKGVILDAVTYASTKGIGDMTLVSSLMQFCAGWLYSIHPAATANFLRLLADQIDARARGDQEAEGRICEAIMLNGMAFTAAVHAEKSGGRN